MSQPTSQSISPSPTHPDQELEQAKQRADRAEKELAELRAAVQRMESRQPGAPSDGKPADSQSADSATSGSTATKAEPSTATDQRNSAPATEDVLQDLRRDSMMAHLFDSLAAGKNIGHYGRLVFVMVAHHFLADDELITWLRKDPDVSDEEARALLRQVEDRDYNPPRRDRILAWQAQQEFPILPNAGDPDCGNVYRTLKFPDNVYEHIEEYREEKAAAEQS